MKTKKNLIRSPDEYTRYYGDFRGVDFSSEHTQVNDKRFAYAINMYKDYKNGEGNAVETIPGFRRRFIAPNADTSAINGIHEYTYITDTGERKQHILVHSGTELYEWASYPNSVNVLLEKNILLSDDQAETVYPIDFECESIRRIIIDSIELNDFEYDPESKKITLGTSIMELHKGKTCIIEYYESQLSTSESVTTNDHKLANVKSKSFVFNNALYIIDGQHYYKYDGNELTNVADESYVPTIYASLPLGKLSPIKLTDYEYEQTNLLNKNFIHTYVADGTSTYPIYASKVKSTVRIRVYDEELDSSHYTVDLAKEEIRFAEGYIPPSPTDKQKDETYAGVEITFEKTEERAKEELNQILGCTIVALFDKKVFLSGNPKYPNNVWYCGASTVFGSTRADEDPSYFGEINVIVDGVENAPITGMIPVADTLAVLKNHAVQDGTVYFHSRLETSSHIIPVTYPAQQGLSGYGCLGACVNFLDDPIFVSSLGVEAIGQLSVRLERAIEHRSTMVDAKLANSNLNNAQLTEWGGYLIVLVDGCIYMADSRQMFTSDLGTPQYEWYYLENIGVYPNQIKEYYYSPVLYSDLIDSENNVATVEYDGQEYEITIADKIYDVQTNQANNLTNSAVTFDIFEAYKDIVFSDERFPNVYFVIKETWDGSVNKSGDKETKYKAILCEDRGSYSGGYFYPANLIANVDDNLFFGTDCGFVCSFNFDQRTHSGEIPATSYSFDKRTIYCGIATKMDNCGVPHLNKSTIKKSTVIKTKSMASSAAKVKIRTNKNAYKSIARISSRVLSFDDMDFSDFSFVSGDQTIFTVKEKEKHWVEKQHWVYSDEYQKPFSVNYIAFRYKISGRIKE